MTTTPKVWLLLGKGTGGNGQIRNLAEALGWPYETKQLVYDRASNLPNLLLGASLLGIDRRASSPLRPPWPDLLIAGSRRSSPIAQWIKKASGGTTMLVHLMHTQTPLAWFDLVVTTPQYRLPRRANVLHNTVPLNHIPEERLRAAAARWAPTFRELPRPHVALLVGGNSSSYVLDAETAARLGHEAAEEVRVEGGSILLTTSARTPPQAEKALRQEIDVPVYHYAWSPEDTENPYLGFLALADRFIVTADSASQLAEASATGKPVRLFDWPLRPASHSGLKGLMRRWSDASLRQRDANGVPTHGLTRIYDRLVYLGLIKPPRDFSAYHRALEDRGMISRLGMAANPTPAEPLRDMEVTVGRIRQMLKSPIVRPT